MKAILSFLTLLVVGAGAVTAADLAKIDRKLKANPYTEKDGAGWCLLVFGPEGQTRMWLAVTNNHVQFDRNANGDLSDDNLVYPTQNTSFYELGPVVDPVTKTTYPRLRLQLINRGSKPELFQINFLVSGKFEQQVEPTPLSDCPETAPVIHLDGPLTVGLFVRKPHVDLVVPTGMEELTVTRAKPTFRLTIFVGTHNHGKDVMPTCVLSCGEIGDYKLFEQTECFYPKAEVTFPPRNPEDEPILAIYKIDGD